MNKLRISIFLWVLFWKLFFQLTKKKQNLYAVYLPLKLCKLNTGGTRVSIYR